MIIVNSRLGSKLTSDKNKKQEDYYQHLAKEILDNFYNETCKRPGIINECAHVKGSFLCLKMVN